MPCAFDDMSSVTLLSQRLVFTMASQNTTGEEERRRRRRRGKENKGLGSTAHNHLFRSGTNEEFHLSGNIIKAPKTFR